MTEQKIPEMRIGMLDGRWTVVMADMAGWVSAGSWEDVPDSVVSGWTPIGPSAATQTAEQAQPGEVAEPCHCGGRRWVEDKNWSPQYPEIWRGERSPGNGLVPCGTCNFGGWNVKEWEVAAGSPGTETTKQETHWGREEGGGESAHDGADPDDCYVCRTAFLADELGRVQEVADRAKAKVDGALAVLDETPPSIPNGPNALWAIQNHRSQQVQRLRAALSGVTSETEKR